VPKKRRAAPSTVDAAARFLRSQSILDVEGLVRLDLDREQRTGIPEVVIAEGKTVSAIRAAAGGLVRSRGRAIITRCPERLNLAGLGGRVERFKEARIAVIRKGPKAKPTGGRVAILTGGASDRKVAEEARVIAEELGCAVRVEHDVGVAALVRAIDALARLATWKPHAYIVAAGREGALAPVVAGLVQGPVIGLPVSTGYGHRGKGEAALSTMLQSCSPLVTVNIDAGFIAGACAAQVASRIALASRA
jgi:pyridinium-3,5-biscarboxylic acid mononucleotide synthase